ncbi:MAG TPA: helix-turn-helix transcriptional regulator [Bacteroidales bacterium]|nr:helix-turn-helix transcriptional regulator [Bacteroidales bacterium]
MKFKEKYTISKDFENLFAFRDEKEELDHEAHMIMFRFLSELEEYYTSGKNLKKSNLAAKLGVSPSYITQLYKGDKLLNFTMLAKIQKEFNITFEVKAHKNESLYSVDNLNIETLPSFPLEPEGFWVWHKLNKPDYASSADSCDKRLKTKRKRSESAA